MRLFATRSEAAARRKGLGPRAAFTLVEIILAIGVATGLLLVALTFYQQARDMRQQLLEESDRVATIRLVLDRLAGDLRGAQPQASPGNEFTGDSNSMSFVKEAYTSLPLGAPAGALEPTDLVRVSLTTLFASNESSVVVSGLDRSEAPLAPAVASVPPSTNFDEVSVIPPEQTNVVSDVFADCVRFVRFRYWDGAAWQVTWTNLAPPPGVELVLSTVANADDAEPDAYPSEAFRRVVVVPGGLRRPPPEANASTNALSTL